MADAPINQQFSNSGEAACHSGISYDPSAPEYRPRMFGGHPFKTATRFLKDDAGRLLLDDGGFPVPLPHPVDAVTRRETTPEERAQARERVDEINARMKRAMAKDQRRIKKRQSIGDPDCVQSRDEDFPLLAVLRRDGLAEAIRVVIAYRRLVALCAADPLKGQSIGSSEAVGMNVEYRSVLRDGVAEVNAAHKEDYVNGVPGGEIEYDGRIRKSKGAYDIPAIRKASGAVDDSPSIRTESLHIRVTEDVLLERIDALPRLMRIRSALGPLVDPFEDAVLGGQTLGAIGRSTGLSGRSAEIGGKALVMQAIGEVDRFLGVKKHTPANDNYLIEHRKIA